MSKDTGIVSIHPVSSGSPTDNKEDVLHIMHNSSEYFLILRLTQKWTFIRRNKILAITSKKEGTVSIPSFRQ